MPRSATPSSSSRSARTGDSALAHSRRTRPGVSSPARVVRSIRVMALSSQAACHAFFTLRRVVRVAVRRSTALRLTRAPCTQSSSRAVPGLRGSGAKGGPAAASVGGAALNLSLLSMVMRASLQLARVLGGAADAARGTRRRRPGQAARGARTSVAKSIHVAMRASRGRARLVTPYDRRRRTPRLGASRRQLMQLSRFPRRRYTDGPTPLEPLPRLSDHLGGPAIWVKRDDLTGLAFGGNKTRKLEFLVADALAQGADTLLTTGAVQSNHCRLTAAAASKEGLACRLLLEERVPGSYDPDASGNNFLFGLLGVERVEVVPGGTDLNARLAGMAEELAAEGRNAYVVPGGGSNALGSLGYVACARELQQQAFELGVAFDEVVVASGSGGTHSGLLAGLLGLGAGLPVAGVS